MVTVKKTTLSFLSDLKKNNDRDWFKTNQAFYTDAKNNFENLIQEIINKIIEFEPVMKGLDSKSCIYRLNRDIRFSKDKSPYKPNFGAFIVRGGKNNLHNLAGYYIHLEPGNCFVAGGAYMPPSPWLAAIREKIDQESEVFKKIIAQKEFIRYFGQISGEKL